MCRHLLHLRRMSSTTHYAHILKYGGGHKGGMHSMYLRSLVFVLALASACQAAVLDDAIVAMIDSMPGLAALGWDRNAPGDICKGPWTGVFCSMATRWHDGVQIVGLQPYSLTLRDVNMGGSIPPLIGKMNFTDITLANTGTTGVIPPELFQAELSTLELTDVALTGPLPATIARCSKLRVLHLINTQLTGKLPAEMSALQNLEELTVSGSKFDLTNPDHVTKLPKLWMFWAMNYTTPACPRVFTTKLSSCNVQGYPECGCALNLCRRDYTCTIDLRTPSSASIVGVAYTVAILWIVSFIAVVLQS